MADRVNGPDLSVLPTPAHKSVDEVAIGLFADREIYAKDGPPRLARRQKLRSDMDMAEALKAIKLRQAGLNETGVVWSAMLTGGGQGREV